MFSRTLLRTRALITYVKGKEDYLNHAKKNTSYILNFSADWCGPCKFMAPILEKKEKEANGKWVVLKVNVDLPENEQLCEEFQASSIPLMVFFKNGKEVDRTIGGMKDAVLDEKIQKILWLFMPCAHIF